MKERHAQRKVNLCTEGLSRVSRKMEYQCMSLLTHGASLESRLCGTMSVSGQDSSLMSRQAGSNVGVDDDDGQEPMFLPRERDAMRLGVLCKKSLDTKGKPIMRCVCARALYRLQYTHTYPGCLLTEVRLVLTCCLVNQGWCGREGCSC